LNDSTAPPAGGSPAAVTGAPLIELGWDAGFEVALQETIRSLGPAPGRRLAPGRVLRRDKTTCAVAFPEPVAHVPINPQVVSSPLEAPTTGDFVLVVDGEIRHVLERRTCMMRAGYRDLDAQLLAANVDTVLVVSSLANDFRARRIERLLVVAWQTGAVPIVVLTKADCCDDVGAAYDETAAVAPGAPVHVVSALTGEGIEALAAELAPRTTAVMIGSSGVGKSTLANALGGGALDLATTDVRADGKGRHTTVTRELVRLANGALMIDTPGLRAIGLWDAVEALGAAFSDVEELAATCRFGDCAHDREPGCAVKAAIAAGALDTDRLESYRSLQREQQRLAARTDARLRAERRAELRALYKERKTTYYR